MTWIENDPADFAAEALAGFVAANARYVRPVDGGVVRSTKTDEGRVAVVIGGGSGHYPAFAGLVGAGLAAGAVAGNLFASPSAGQVYRVSRACDRGAGVLLSYGNYAGDVLHFEQGAERLRADGIDVRTVVVTDDIASAGPDEWHKRRGIAGDLPVFKIAGAAAEAGYDLDALEAVANLANQRTRSLGVAFAGCTHPGADAPLFTVPTGFMAVGLGIHGEPGISEEPIPSANGLAERLVEALLEERPDGAGERITVILNGLGTVKYEELFVVFGAVQKLLSNAGLQIVEPECGELVTSLDMAGLSLTLVWLDDELEALWTAPADSPGYRKGSIHSVQAAPEEYDEPAAAVVPDDPTYAVHRSAVPAAIEVFRAIHGLLVEEEGELGRIDAIAGDGDHGIGMSRGAEAALAKAESMASVGAGIGGVLGEAGDAWAERGGGTSGALWGAAIVAAGRTLASATEMDSPSVADAVNSALEAMCDLGKASVGDKTMIDSFAPFNSTLRAEVDAGNPLAQAWDRAATAATEAAEATAALRPRLGRARPLAEKSVGHPDAGAVSFAMIVTTIGKVIAQK